MSFQKRGTTGVAVVKQENSYYPFSLVMPNSQIATPTLANKKLYNGGSEWQNDFGNLPDLYQTYYRSYDAALGRFTGIDPKAEVMDALSPYHYAGNNPVLYNEPMGDMVFENGRNVTQHAGQGHDSFRPDNGFDESWLNMTVKATDGGSGGGGGGKSDLEAAKGGDPTALARYAAANGAISISDPYVLSDIANNNSYIVYDDEGNWSIQYNNSFVDQTGAAIRGGSGTILSSTENFKQQGSNIDWGGATNALIGVVGGIAEVGLGVLTSELGIGALAIGDGGARTILNGARLIGYLSGDKTAGDSLPGNFGAVIGKAIDNDNGVNVNKVGSFQNILGGANDVATMALFHTNWNTPALNAPAAVAGLLSDAYTIGYYYGKLAGQ